MKLRSVLLAAAMSFGCSSRGGLAPQPPEAPTGAAGGGAAGAPPPTGLCPSRTGRRPDQLALLGQDGADIIFVHDDGTIRRVPGPGNRNAVAQQNGWIAAYDIDSTAT